MKFLQKFKRYMSAPVDADIQKEIDGQSLRSIRIVSLLVFLIEVAILILFFISNINGLNHDNMISLISVCYCIVLCAMAYFLSNRMLQSKDLHHSRFFIFKISFFVLFTVWAIFVDYRHYKLNDQMLTFFAVNLVMSCFIIFRPWIGTVLVGGSFAVLYAALYSVDKAAGIEPLNFLVLALASVACNTVRCHGQIDVASKAIRLNETIDELKSASRRDGLTGLLNRLALEDDASKTDGRHMTAYMIDINYFKEINDRYGHAAGDTILREVSEALLHLYPGAHYYRYGGDEFLVLSYKTPKENYGADIYDFRQEKYGITVELSIGNAQASPANYQELFDLIARADKALYVTKQRTHSAEHGGHDRRKRATDFNPAEVTGD